MCSTKPANLVDSVPQESLRAVTTGRLRQRGKFFSSDKRFFIRGVTYGTFRPDKNGDQYPAPRRVDQDFAMMMAHGINAIRTYTVPPSWLLDLAHRHGLVVMIGLPWEQHITFLNDKRRCRSIFDRVRQGVRRCAGQPAVFCYAVGNEIPASILPLLPVETASERNDQLHRVLLDI
jgi:beta-galactosidase/beta-glucuronidase